MNRVSRFSSGSSVGRSKPTDHQPIVRIDAKVATLCQVAVVLGAFDLLVAQPIGQLQPRSFNPCL